MAKTPKRKTTQPEAPFDFFGNVRLQSRLIFALAFLLYANTLRHGFVLDDGIVITENVFTQAGFGGLVDIFTHDSFYGFFQKEGMDTLVAGGRYRPLSLAFFAVLYQFAGANPFVFHLFTVLAFALCCLVFYRTALVLLGGTGNRTALLTAWMAAVLFAVHPIHTEVVANIKSSDEILALLGALAALYATLSYRRTGNVKWAAAAGALMFLGCLSKENAAAYALLIPAALWFFRSADASDAKRSAAGSSWPVLTALALFLLIRGSILPWSAMAGGAAQHELLNNPFLKLEDGTWTPFSFSEKMATILYTLWKYLQLLVAPHPLTHDYYPRHIGILNFGHPLVWAGLLAYAFLAYWTLRGIRRRDATAFALLMFLLPLGIVSNLVFPIGTTMSERFAFMPSAGCCLLAGMLFARLAERGNPWGWRIFVIAVLLFSIKTVARNFAWASNETLYKTDIAVSGNSLKLQLAYANVLLERARSEQPLQRDATCKEALQLLDKSLAIYPDFATALNIRGGVYQVMERHPEAIDAFRKALAASPDDLNRKKMLAAALREAGRFYGQQKKDMNNAMRHLEEAWRYDSEDPETARLTGVAYMVQGNREKALEWYARAEGLAQENAAALWELGVAYNNLGMSDKARELQQKAYAVDPTIVERVQQ